MKNIFRYVFIIALLVVNISCDQLSKSIVRAKMIDQQEINVLKHLKLIKVENTGAFLSLGTTIPQPFKAIILWFVPLVFLLIAFVYVLTKRTLTLARITAICFVIGGGVGNIFDRLIHGSVTDFMHLH